jgi:hypothetical protein
MNFRNFRNVCLGGCFGLASGYCYHKYRVFGSLGFGLGGIITLNAQSGLKKLLDLDKDGDVDLDDLEIAQERYDINYVGGLSFVGAFGIGYFVSKFV